METATYGTEFVAGRIGTEQVIELCHTLRSMENPIEKYTWLLGGQDGPLEVPHKNWTLSLQQMQYQPSKYDTPL